MLEYFVVNYPMHLQYKTLMIDFPTRDGSYISNCNFGRLEIKLRVVETGDNGRPRETDRFDVSICVRNRGFEKGSPASALSTSNQLSNAECCNFTRAPKGRTSHQEKLR